MHTFRRCNYRSATTTSQCDRTAALIFEPRAASTTKAAAIPGFLQFVGDLSRVNEMPDQVAEVLVLLFRHLSQQNSTTRGYDADSRFGKVETPMYLYLYIMYR